MIRRSGNWSMKRFQKIYEGVNKKGMEEKKEQKRMAGGIENGEKNRRVQDQKIVKNNGKNNKIKEKITYLYCIICSFFMIFSSC